MFPTGGLQYSQVCGRIIGYQFGYPGAFVDSKGKGIDGPYVDGVSLTYGSPRQHIWTFANAIDKYPLNYEHKCPCTNVTEQRPIPIPSFVGNDYFCETGVPPGEGWDPIRYFPADPLWDGGGCGQLAHAAHLIIHHGFVSSYFSQLMLIWKSDCVHLKEHL